ncbi:MAG: hypothetical protein II820_01600 [Ruminiclostridium sp.]|nr:hypothetical protein [Ruminiclostridium sp.]
MAFCKHCGGQLPEGVNNCPNCGAPVTSGEAQQNNFNNNGSQSFAGKDVTSEFDVYDLNSNNKWAYILSYLWILFFLPLLVCPDSKAGKFHANQGLILFIFSVAVGVAAAIVGALTFIPIPFMGGLFRAISAILGFAGSAVHIAAFIYQMVNILNNKAVELPIIGKYRLIK